MVLIQGSMMRHLFKFFVRGMMHNDSNLQIYKLSNEFGSNVVIYECF
jgi:hypothetical protein